MATVYVSNALPGDNTDGSTWLKAYTSIAGALASASLTGAGPHIIYVDSAHAGSSVGVAWTINTANQSVSIISVNRGGSTTTGHSGWLAGASETNSTNVNTIAIGQTTSGKMFVYGVTFNQNSGSSNTNDILITTTPVSLKSVIIFDTCTFDLKGSGATAQMLLGPVTGGSGVGVKLEFRNCTIKIGNSATNDPILIQQSEVLFNNLTISYSGASKPSSVFNFTSSNSFIEIFNSDLSGYEASGGSLIDLANFDVGHFHIINCKLSSVPSLVTGSWGTSGRASVTLINVDSGNTNYKYEHRNRFGTLTTSTSVYRNNGSVFDSRNLSCQITTTSDCSEFEPFTTPWLHRWMDTTGSRRLRMELIRDSVTNFTNREIWGEFEVITGTSPQGSLRVVRHGEPYDTAATNLTNSSESWTHNLTNPNAMYLESNVNITSDVLIRSRISVTAASITLFLDPCINIVGFNNNSFVRWLLEGPYDSDVFGGRIPHPSMNGRMIG